MLLKSMSNKPIKILLIRFSSFGDIVQSLSILSVLKNRWPEAEIHWVTRSEFKPLIEDHPALDKVWILNRKLGIRGLFQIAEQLNKSSFTKIYDAHNNLRSLFICTYLIIAHVIKGHKPPEVLRRSIRRIKRFLLFNFRYNLFELPFSGQRDLLEPLVQWGISATPPSVPQIFIHQELPSFVKSKLQNIPIFIALAPSAAFALKRWPLNHWKKLIQLWLDLDQQIHFILLGGPDDLFLNELVVINPNKIHNFAGKLSLSESASLVKRSHLLIANDTGLLHVGEQLGHPTVALMGPAPFGFPCRRETTEILELDLKCRPCSKHGQGPCRNAHFQLCLDGISPELVLQKSIDKIQSNIRPNL